ncbi:MAG TPA: DUF1990 domain-containing protein [Acidimicrobiales bacterium]|nr:DUF1990 domain-containing protein [Acidimicrobiales bacterium]
MIILLRHGQGDLARLYEQLRVEALTYGDVGATATPDLPSGYHHVSSRRIIGRGPADWATARQAVLNWAPHRGAGFAIYPPHVTANGGETVLVTRRLGLASLVIPCRVVYRTDEVGRVGFAYGTLPGHPEEGEESFHVVRTAEDEVIIDIRAFSRPADQLAKLGGPLGRLVQGAVTDRYLDAMEQAVKRPSSPR